MYYKEIVKNAKIIYNYLKVETTILKSDIIMGLGCMDTSIPKVCSQLYKNGYGNIVVFSGNVGKGTENVLKDTEAKMFENVAINNGVPNNVIILENNATNTYENFKYTKDLLEEKQIDFESVIIVHKPYVKRRCMAIADIEMSGKKFYITSQDIDLDTFIEEQKKNKTMSFDDIINEIVGEISIILTTPKYKLQSEQFVPNNVLDAYSFLIDCGYSKYVVSDEMIEKALTKLKK